MSINTPELFGTYDVGKLLENVMEDCELAEELLDRFQSRLVSGRESLESSLEKGDLSGATRIAHSLKGEAGTLAASQMHETAAKLELALQTSEEAAILPLLDELREAVDRCLNAYATARCAIREPQF